MLGALGECGGKVRCASLKANMGHLEASAAGAGLVSLLVTPVLSGAIVANAQLRQFLVLLILLARILKISIEPVRRRLRASG